MSQGPNILCIETSGGFGTVALQRGEHVVRSEIHTPRSQTEKLISHIDALLGDAGISLRQLDAISFSRGPGSFIGVRLAASVAQGLAVAAGVGLAPVSSMAALASKVLPQDQPAPDAAPAALVCLDARMGEVYWAEYTQGPNRGIPATSGERLLRPEDVVWPLSAGAGVAVGSGFDEYPALAARAAEHGYSVAASIQPLAEDLLPFARAAIGSAGLVAPERWRIEYLRDENAWRTLRP